MSATEVTNRRLQNKSRPGFGLLELIIIIAVVFFVFVLLIPSLRSAKDSSYLTACRSNLMQIGVAAANYAADNNDYLPPWQGQSISPFRQSGILGEFGCANPAIYPYRRCPGQRAALSPAAEVLGGDYLFNPHWAFLSSAAFHASLARSGAGGSQGLTDLTGWYAKLNSYPKFAVLACDAIYDSMSLNHPSANGAACFNLLYCDGHVQSLRETYVSRGLSGDVTLAAYGGAQGAVGDAPLPIAIGVTGAGVMGPKSPDNQLWLLDDYLDILETEAIGQDPMSYVLYSGQWSPADRMQPMPLQHREVHIKGFDSPNPASNRREKAIVNFY
jgi:prepilin-type processing-associated H-X9-DG protein